MKTTNKKLINIVFNGEFPQRGQYFYAIRSDGIIDYSYYARLDLDPVRESVNAATKAIFNAANKRLK